jgi:hypothetical protein
VIITTGYDDSIFSPNIMRLIGGVLATLIIIALFYALVIWMPGSPRPDHVKSSGDPELISRLRTRVEKLASEIGPRSVRRPEGLNAARDYISSELTALGYEVKVESYLSVEGVETANLFVDVPGINDGGKFLLIGAHYDTAGDDSPGADDNATGVAALLELASYLRDNTPLHNVRLTFFVNEEAPFGITENMGSYHHAKMIRKANLPLAGMISLESIGYFSDKPKSQRYPQPFSWFYPDRGDFIAFVTDLESARFLRRVIGSFRAFAEIPSEGVTAPRIFSDISLSDHWSFWAHGYAALMITDTVPFRNPHYHEPTDTPDTLDFGRMSLVVEALERAIVKVELR